MEKELETIELFIDEREDSGISAISFVYNPAIQEDFTYLSEVEELENEHRIELQSYDDDKRLVIGLALVPDKLIKRRNKGFEYNITFSSDTVRKASEKYLKSMNMHNTTVEHKTSVEGVYLSETWIVEDSKIDKTALYGLDAPVGAWAVSMRVENDDVWESIKLGEYKGFSIEGLFGPTERTNAKLSGIEKIAELIREYEESKK